MTIKTYKHQLVPSHEKISNEEKEKLMIDMEINFKDLPKILKNDPAISELDLKPGDIVKIKRKSLTARETVFYRGVTDAWIKKIN